MFSEHWGAKPCVEAPQTVEVCIIPWDQISGNGALDTEHAYTTNVQNGQHHACIAWTTLWM